MPFPRRRTLLAGSILAVGALVTLGWWLADPVPEDRLGTARAALSEARRARAAEFAPAEFALAEQAWSDALALVRQESAVLTPLRSFDSVRAQVDRIVELAAAAEARARHTVDSLETRAERVGRIADAGLRTLEAAADHYPIGFVDRDALSRSREHRSHREAALRNGRLALAVELAEAQAAAVGHARADLLGRLHETLARVPAWQEAARRLRGARSTAAVIVDKAWRRLYLYRSGRTDSFDVEFGRNWLGPKRMEGDDATPEGEYRVTRRLGRGQTRYHRALLIDYPNAADRDRFARARAAGDLPPGARIGGSIELHGGGGRAVDWTDGCVALSDADMERLFELVPEGTPVLIAGSLTRNLPYLDEPEDH